MKNYVRLTCYEWKRIWMQPVVWVLLILCMIYSVYAFSGISVDSDARQVYAKVGEHLTEENYRILETNLQKKESGQRAVTQVQTEEGVKQYIEVPEWGGPYNVEYLSQALIQAQGNPSV